jgi:hypothetical protein
MSAMSAIESVESLPQEIEIDLTIVLQALEAFGCADLFKIIKKATLEAERKSKLESKPKKEDGPKKPTPPQFKKPKKWVDYTLEHANANGWEEFILKDKKEEIVMPASELRDGVHVHPGSGKPMTMTQAMSLSKQRYSPREGHGSHPVLYQEFLAWYDEQVVDVPVEKVVVEEKPVVRKTAEQKAAEVAAKKAELEAAAALAKAAREAAAAKKKEEKEAEKEAEKQRKKAEKEAAKAAAAAAAKAPAVPAAAVKTAVKVVVKVKAPAAAAKPVAPVAPAWSCPNDGNAHMWTFKGTKYLRNYEGEVWLDTESGEMGVWCGVYRTEGDFIDNSVADPYEEENAE